MDRKELFGGETLSTRSAFGRPRLLDLYCCAGGGARGYQEAGFYVVGVDHKSRSRYAGDEFIQDDALSFLDGILLGERGAGFFDAIHASPPCQGFTPLRFMWNAKDHDDLVGPTRDLLEQTGLPYVIENVRAAPLKAHTMLCGTMFGLGTETAELRRHRYFETNWTMGLVPPCQHGQKSRVIGVYGGHGRDRRRKVNTQDFSTEERREAMGIDWMTGAELSEAIPPAYTRYIGERLRAQVSAWAS